jgi:ABC-type uncharacterized transport system ATPase subunit
MTTPVLEVRHITKRFPGVVANENVNLKLHRGEILALLGENGAGKSTLMNIIYGLYQPTSGEILVNGKPVTMHSPNDAIALGIGMVHQHFQLVPPMTVAENIMLGSETVKNGLLDTRTVAERIRELSHRYRLDVDPYAVVEDLPVGVRQRVEIVKTLYRNADILILDEPTAVLTPQEIEGLFEVMELLRSQGKSIIFITHKLKEVLRVADRIAVLRQGRVVGEADPKTATQESLAALMVGRTVILTVDKTPARPGAPVLELTNVVAKDDLGQPALRGVSLSVCAGEIVGVAGVRAAQGGERPDPHRRAGDDQCLAPARHRRRAEQPCAGRSSHLRHGRFLQCGRQSGAGHLLSTALCARPHHQPRGDPPTRRTAGGGI